ncbi:hypothetical protein LTR39_000306 [Cryomyces antarcticus]|nr:hypothetical protein LTR39_000306 [Cryomyces antarcticus]
MNKAELDANPVLRKENRLLADLNVQPKIPDEAGNDFDAATCVVSIDYLTKPKEVLESLKQRTKEGGMVHLIISNRCFPTKAVGRWLRVGEEERLNMVGDYLHFAGWKNIEIVDLSSAEEGREPPSGIAGLMQFIGMVIVTSSSDAKLERARALGVDHTINYRTQSECQNEVMRLTSDHGADIIFETGGALTLKRSFDCVAFGGLINCIGYLSCKKDAPGDRTNANALALRRNVTLKGILNEPKDRFEEMLAVYEKHGIHPVVDKVFAFEESKEALQYLYKGGHFGKVVIKVVDQ